MQYGSTRNCKGTVGNRGGRMSSDNTTAMKMERSYNRLLCAILQGKPKRIIARLTFEAADCPETFKEFDEQTKQLLQEATKDSINYFIHYQSGRTVAILRTSPLGRKLAKGAFKDE